MSASADEAAERDGPLHPDQQDQRYCNKCGAVYVGGPSHSGCSYYAARVHHHNPALPPSTRDAAKEDGND